MEYEHEWTVIVTPGGREIPTLRVRRSIGSETEENFEARWQRNKAKHNNGNGMGTPLGMQARMAGWPSPTFKDSESSGSRQPRTETHHYGTTLTEASRLTGWPTPQTHDTHERGNTEADHHHFPHDLSNMAAMAGWPSPNAHDGRRPGFEDDSSTQGTNLRRDVRRLLTGWATPGTPREHDRENTPIYSNPDQTSQSGHDLGTQAKMAGWMTPTVPRAHDTENTAGADPPNQNQNHIGRQVGASTAETDGGGGFRLNPAFSLWLMAGDSVTPELIRTCPRGLAPSGRREMRSLSLWPQNS